MKWRYHLNNWEKKIIFYCPKIFPYETLSSTFLILIEKVRGTCCHGDLFNCMLTFKNWISLEVFNLIFIDILKYHGKIIHRIRHSQQKALRICGLQTCYGVIPRILLVCTHRCGPATACQTYCICQHSFSGINSDLLSLITIMWERKA